MKRMHWIRTIMVMMLILSLCLGVVSAVAEDTQKVVHSEMLTALRNFPAGNMTAAFETSLNNRRTEMFLDGFPKDIDDNSYREEEPNNSSNQANNLYHDYTIRGQLSSSDMRDYFTFTLTSRSKVVIHATANRPSFTMQVLNPKGNVIGTDTTGQYSKPYYYYEFYGTLNAGTYDLCLLDQSQALTSYLFYITISCTHSTYTTKVVMPTCTSEGYTQYTCKDCKTKWKDNYVNMLDHKAILVPGIPSTCISTGLSEGAECSMCGTVLTAQTSLPLADHTEVPMDTVEPTCMADGHTGGTHCDVCDIVIVEPDLIPATGHALTATSVSLTLKDGDVLTLSDIATGCEHLNDFIISGTSSDETTLNVLGNAIHAMDTGYATLRLSATLDNFTFNTTLTALIHAQNTMILPSNLITIETEAFLNSPAEEFILPEGCTTIGVRAFAGSNVKMIHIPDTVTYIAPDAFEGCGEVYIVANPGSVAEAFAELNGFPCGV